MLDKVKPILEMSSDDAGSFPIDVEWKRDLDFDGRWRTTKCGRATKFWLFRILHEKHLGSRVFETRRGADLANLPYIHRISIKRRNKRGRQQEQEHNNNHVFSQ